MRLRETTADNSRDGISLKRERQKREIKSVAKAACSPNQIPALLLLHIAWRPQGCFYSCFPWNILGIANCSTVKDERWWRRLHSCTASCVRIVLQRSGRVMVHGGRHSYIANQLLITHSHTTCTLSHTRCTGDKLPESWSRMSSPVSIHIASRSCAWARVSLAASFSLSTATTNQETQSCSTSCMKCKERVKGGTE